MRAPAELLPVLSRLSETLRRLNTAEEAKASAASLGRHEQLDSILTEEQALILELRGLEQKRISILNQTGWNNLSFRQILEQEDEDGREKLAPFFEQLRQSADLLRSTKENADRILKVRLHQIRFLSNSENGPHYDHYG
ncbi:MAG: flagellar export chaperone FlgN [Clostridium sp.]